jgi:hypothetical protein
MAPVSTFPDPINTGIQLINKGFYFEAHEVLEQFWRSDHSRYRNLYQGLIQVSVCLFHLQRGNHQGAIKLSQKAFSNLLPYLDENLPVDVNMLVSDLKKIEQKAPEISKDPKSFNPVTILQKL